MPSSRILAWLARWRLPPGLTREGVVAGTPAYMSPEHARARASSTPRTDVYSLGATLYEALTGQMPFAGALHTVLRRIEEEEPIPPRRFDHEIAADLETICMKAMAKEPGRRYQSARDLGDDLSRWSRGESIHARPATRLERAWRWCSRNPGLAGLTASLAIVVLAGFLGVVWQWRRAEVNRQRSEAHAQGRPGQFRARSPRWSINSTPDSTSKAVLATPGLEKVKHDVIGEMLQYYKDFLDQHQNDPTFRLALADSCLRLGTLTYESGDKTDALGLVRRALRDFEQLAQASPNDRAIHDKMVLCLNNIGLIQTVFGDHRSAEQTYQRGIELINEQLRKDPGDLKLRSRLAAMHGNIANLLVYRDHTRAREAYLQVLEIQKELVKRDPTQLTFKSHLALTYHNLTGLGHGDEQEAWCQQAIQLRKQLVDQDPTSVLYRRNLARSHQSLGAIQIGPGRTKVALQSQEECCRLLQQVVADQPSSTENQADLAEAYHLLAERLHSNGREVEEKTALEQSHAIYQKLAHSDPDNKRVHDKMSLVKKEIDRYVSKAKGSQTTTPATAALPRVEAGAASSPIP